MKLIELEDRKMRLSKKIISFMLMIVICASCCITALAANYESEPNNSIGKANTISINTTYYGSGSDDYPDYYDYYKFSTSSDGYIQVKASKGYQDHTLNLYVLKYDGTDHTTLLSDIVGYSSETKTTKKIGLPKGTYYLGISYDGGGDYNFTVMFTASNYWEKESNDSLAAADSVSLNKTYYGSGNDDYPDYYDYYKFTTSSDGYIQVKASKGYQDHTLNLYVLKYDGTDHTTLLSDIVGYSSETKTTKKIGLPKGTYYLEISYDGGGDYNFHVLFSTSQESENTTKPSAPKPTTNKTTATKPDKTESTINKTTTKSPERTDNNGDEIVNTTANTREPSTFVTVPSIPDEPEKNKEFSDNNYTYYIYNYTLIIINYIGDNDVAVIPSKVNTPDGEYPVTGIGDNAFSNSCARTIQVPSSVTSFGENAFGEDEDDGRVIMCEEGSPAASYCQNHGISYVTTNSDNEIDGQVKDGSKTLTFVFAAIAILAVIALVIVIIINKNKKNGNSNIIS